MPTIEAIASGQRVRVTENAVVPEDPAYSSRARRCGTSMVLTDRDDARTARWVCPGCGRRRSR